MERVLCAAIYVDTGKAEPPRRSYAYPATGLVFAGWRHGDCFTTLAAWASGLTPDERAGCNLRDLERVSPGEVGRLTPDQRGFLQDNVRGFDQGFLTSTGRYVSREEAAQIAAEAGQARPGIKSLTSEDIY